MPITYKTNVVVMEGVCGIEDGDELLQWLIDHPKGKLNLKQTTHIHTALLQIILCHSPTVSVYPEDSSFKRLWSDSIEVLMETE